MKKSKVLLVGGSGYLGQSLLPFFSNSRYSVWYTGTKSINNTRYLQIDFSCVETFNNLNEHFFDIIIILASKISAIGTASLKHGDLKINTISYGNFLEFIKEKKITNKIVYVSSMTVYDSNNISPVLETDTLSPLHTYGLSKQLAENITTFFCNNSEINGVILRIPGLYGGNRRNGFIYNTIKKIKSGEPIALHTKGLGYWEAIHILDLCLLFEIFLKNYHWQNKIEVFNLSYGEETDFYETAKYIAIGLKYKGKFKYENEKGYVPFYMSNEKVKQFIEIKTDYFSSLKNYINSF